MVQAVLNAANGGDQAGAQEKTEDEKTAQGMAQPMNMSQDEERTGNQFLIIECVSFSEGTNLRWY